MRTGRPAIRAVLVLVVVALSATTAVLLAPSDHPRRSALNNAQITRHFVTIAFGREHASRPAQHLAKWEGGIRYALVRWISDRNSVKAEKAIHRQMALLAKLTGLRISQSPVFEANFLIALTRERLFEWQVRRALAGANRILGAEISKANCAGFFSQNADSKAIISARVIIPVDRAARNGLLQRCVVEETAQVLGLPNDADGGVQSVFNDGDRSAALSRLDRLFIRLLYHPHLRAGMSRPATIKTVNDILPALRRRMRY